MNRLERCIVPYRYKCTSCGEWIKKGSKCLRGGRKVYPWRYSWTVTLCSKCITNTAEALELNDQAYIASTPLNVATLERRWANNENGLI